jgi:glycosyltransferase involved in cell wall biosynthesis
MEPGGDVDAVVCIPTYRRPEHLRLTLASVLAQVTSRRFALVVAENDAAGRHGLSVVAETLRRAGLPALCVVEPGQGNCHAINAAFETALDVFPSAAAVLMLDDDEVASPHWLESMLDAAEASGADVVGGPVHPRLPEGAAATLALHPAFRPAYGRTGPVPVIYGSGNCLIRREVFARLAQPRFDTRFDFLGGGDTDFFVRCREAGMRFHWSAEAGISETVPQERTALRWLAGRGLRIGAVNYRIERKLRPGLAGRIRSTVKSIAILPLAAWQGISAFAGCHDAAVALHPLLVAAGRLLAACGVEPEPYRAGRGRGLTARA